MAMTPKLMRVSASCKLRLPGAVLLALVLTGCPLRPLPTVPPQVAAETPAPHEGVPYDIVAEESLLTLRVYRGGTLASAGHNHLIALHALTGTVYVPADVMRTSFEAHIPVAAFTVDEAALRAQEHSPDFPADVPDAAREGTRRNMLGEALLDSEHSPQIVLQAVRLEPAGQPAPGTGSDAGGEAREVLARVQTTVRGQVRTISVPVRYEFAAGALIASGEAALRQSELGLTPFSALLGALQVQDEMRVRFRIVARAAGARYRPSSASSSLALYTLRSASNMMAGSTATARFNSGSNQ
jgi:hypothetical protein